MSIEIRSPQQPEIAAPRDRADSSPDRLMPAKWSDWHLEELLGEGSSAAVYKAVRTDEAGTSFSAVKILKIPPNGRKEQYIEEIKTMLSLKGHPNIVSIEDYISVSREGSDYILIRMELLRPLDKAAAEECFDEAETRRVGIDICKALEHCQAKKILHFDIKPSNIFRTPDGTYKLGDFGVSRSADEASGTVPDDFTMNFMSPELYRLLTDPGRTDRRSDLTRIQRQYDLYSLGLVLYWLRNGRKAPFLPDKPILTPQDRKEAFLKRMNGEKLPPLPNTSDELARIICKACAFEPDHRYRNPAELKQALEQSEKKPPRARPGMRWRIGLLSLAVLLAAGLSVILFRDGKAPAPAGPSGACGESLSWEISGDLLRIRGTGEMEDYSVQDAPPWSEYRESIVQITVEEGASRIGRYAFFGFSELKEVHLPRSLRRVNEMAFGYCYRLPVLTLPEGVEHMEESIVYRCPGLTRIQLPGSIRLIEGSFAGECENLASIELGEGCTAYAIRNGVLFDADLKELICHPAGLSDLSYTVPETVDTIGAYAFADNRHLQEITLPDSSLISIGSCAFSGCSNLKRVHLPSQIASLGIYAFYDCENLRSIQLPSGITRIDQQAFYHCSALQEIIVPDGVVQIGTAVFSRCERLKKIVLPSSVTSISDSAFEESPHAVIYGESGSYAQTFAEEHQIPFVPIGPASSSHVPSMPACPTKTERSALAERRRLISSRSVSLLYLKTKKICAILHKK